MFGELEQHVPPAGPSSLPAPAAPAHPANEPAVPLIKVACLQCRRLKIRCQPKGDGSAKCFRCDKFNLECEFKDHARGQKRYALVIPAIEHTSETNAGTEDLYLCLRMSSCSVASDNDAKTSPVTTASPKRQRLRNNTSRESTAESANGQLDPALAATWQDPTAISEPPPPSWSLNALLGLRKPEPSPHYSDQFPDAISLDILTAAEVTGLFDFFFAEMNPFLGVLDRALHTPEYVRNISSLLFTSILAVATRHRYRDTYQTLLKQANDHLDTILSRDKKRPWLPTIQALCLLSFWKDSSDDGGWRRIGFAIRLAYEEGLHRLPKDELPTLDKYNSAQTLDKHRTWQYLCCMDQMMSFQRDLPTMISAESISDASTWVHLTRHAMNEDWWLAAALEYSILRYQTRGARVFCMESLARGQSSSADFFRYTARFDGLRLEFQRWRQKWITDGSMFSNPSPKTRVMLLFYASFMAFYISRTRADIIAACYERNQESPHERNASLLSVGECFEDASHVLSTLQHISAQRYALTYLPDTVPVGACAAAVWLLNATKTEALQGQTPVVRDALLAASTGCRAAGLHKTDTQNKLAQFLETLASRVQMPVPGSATAIMPMGQPLPQNGMQMPPTGYGPPPSASLQPPGFDFSGAIPFDNTLGGNYFDPNLDLESFWSFYQATDN